MFVLFLNPRLRFRVKEHWDSVAPPLAPSAKHMNQDLHTFMVLSLDLGVTGGQYAKESWAKQHFHPALLRRLSENPAALRRLKLRAGSEAATSCLLLRGRSAPLKGRLHSHGWAPRGEQLLPEGAGVTGAMGFPTGCGASGTTVPLPGHLCAAHIHPCPGHHSRSVTSRPFQNAKGWATGLFPLGIVAGSPILRILPASFTRIYARPSAPQGKKTSRAHGLPGRSAPDGPSRPGARSPKGSRTLTLERTDEGLPVLDELLDEFVGLVQLRFVRLERLSEVRAVQAAVTEFQRREPHGARGAQPGGAPPREPLRPAAPSTHAERPRLALPTAAGSTGVAPARPPRDVRPSARLLNPAGTRRLRRATLRRGRLAGSAAADLQRRREARAGERARAPPPRLLGLLALQQPGAPSHSSLSSPGGFGAARTC